nr:putative testis-expressed protein 13C [Oryctolagus cuniculus]
MAVDFGDHASGFRHNEVIRFINDEVLMNGGGPEFYVAFRSRSWNEVEDRLQAVVVDPQVPRALKRACAWSALALGVRAAARQREQQAISLHQLLEQVEEREAASLALASELQRLREEREGVTAQLRYTQAALQQATDERDLMRWRLLQAEKSSQACQLPQEVVQGPRVDQLAAIAWPLGEEQREVALGAQGVPHLEAQMPVPGTLLYMPTPGPWVPAMQPPLPVSVTYPYPCHAPLPVGFPYATPVAPPAVLMESEAVGSSATGTSTALAESASQFHPEMIPAGVWATVGSQEAMAHLCDPNCNGWFKYPENLQEGSYLADTRSNCQGEEPGCPHGTAPLGHNSIPEKKEVIMMSQGLVPLGQSGSHDPKKEPGMPQGVTPIGQSSNPDQKNDPVIPQEVEPLGQNSSLDQKKDPMMPQRVATLVQSSRDQKKDLVMPQETAPEGLSSNNNQKKDPVMSQGMVPLGQSSSPGQVNDPVNPVMPNKMAPLEPSSHLAQKRDPVTPQGMSTVAQSSSHTQKKVPVVPNESTPLGHRRNHDEKKNPAVLQETAPLRQNSSQGPKKDPLMPQAKAPLGESSSYCQKKDTLKPNSIATLGPSSSLGQIKDSAMLNGMGPVKENSSLNQKKVAVMPQGTAPLGQSSSHDLKKYPVSLGLSRNFDQKEDTVVPYGKVSFGHNSNHSKEERPEKPLATPLSDSKNSSVKKCLKKQQVPSQKAKQPKGKKASEFQQKAAPGCNPMNWDCPWCKSSNFSWRASCYRCKKIYVPIKSGGVDPGKTH